MARQDAVAKTRSETFDLGFDALCHIESRSMRDVAIGPYCMLSFRCACRIKQALLGKQHKRPLWMLTPPDGSLGSRDFRQRPTNMYRSGAPAFCCLPGYRTVKSQVKFEDAGAVAVTLQPALVAGRQLRTGDTQ